MSTAQAGSPSVGRGRTRVPPPVLEPFGEDALGATERRIYDVIRRTLMAGGVAPGGRLSSRSLADALGVSATPVREALKRLEADGVLESRAKSAYFVRELSRREYREILEVRLRLEGYAAAEAAGKITSDQVAALRRLDRQLAASRTGGDFLRCNFRFHFQIYDAAEAPYTLSLIENAWLRIGPALAKVFGDERDLAEPSAHSRIISALERGDQAAAEAAVHADLMEVADVIESRLAP